MLHLWDVVRNLCAINSASDGLLVSFHLEEHQKTNLFKPDTNLNETCQSHRHVSVAISWATLHL